MSATIGRVLLIPKGEYSGSTVYNSLDWVRYDGVAWVCKVNGTVGVVPVEGANWTVLAQDGSVSGAVEWNNVGHKPFNAIASNGGLDVDGSGDLEIDPNFLTADNVGYDNTSSGLSATTTQDAIDELASGGGGGDTVAWNQIQQSTGATKIATITINNTPTDVYAPSGGGGGASSLDDLSDVAIDTVTLDDGQILAYNQTEGEFQNVDMPTGGHTMKPDPSSNPTESDVVTWVSGAQSNNEQVPSLYGTQVWSNTDTITLLTDVAQGDDTVGTWEDDDTWKSGSRSGWLIDEALYGIGSDDYIHIDFDFKVPEDKSDAVSIYSYRYDDEMYEAVASPSGNPQKQGWYESDGQTPPTYTLTTDTTVQAGKTYYVGVGAIAIKLNAPIAVANAKVCVILRRVRTKLKVISRS